MLNDIFKKGMFQIDPKSTPQQIAAKRALMQMIAPKFGSARYVGEGLGQLASGALMGAQGRQLDKIEGKGREQADAMFAGLLGGPMSILGANPDFAAQPTEAESVAADTMSALGKGGYRESLIGTESGGNWAAQNNETGAGGRKGHFGRVQFGQARLDDAKRAGVIPADMTPEQFMASPEAQMAAEDWHFADLERNVRDLVGTEVNGQKLDMGALVAMAHLGGAGGARKYVETGGRYNPSDSFGTSLSEYAQKHGGAAPSPASNSALPQIPMPELIGLMSNPWLSDEQRGMLTTIYNAQVQAGDPMQQMQVQKAQMELDQMRNPPPAPPPAVPSSFAALDMQAQAAGFAPGTPEYQDFMRNGGAAGTPAAFTALDLQAQAAGFQPGSPEYQEFMATRGAGFAAAAVEKGKATAEAEIAAPSDISSAQTTLGYIDSIKNHPGRALGSGGSSFLGMVPGTSAREFQIEVERLKAGAFMTAIEQLRGMGALSNAEGQTATAAVAALDPSGSEAGFMKRLEEYEAIVKRGMERAQKRIKVPDAEKATPSGAVQMPSDMDPAIWEHMTDEERALFK